MKNEGSDRIDAIVKLGLWLIFIAVLMIIARFGGTSEDTNIKNPQEEIKESETIKEKSYEEKFLNSLD